MSSLLERGDLISLSRAQASVVDVLTAPGGAGEDFTITLPINPPATKDFTYTSVGGETVGDVASALEAILLRDQTHYSVAVGPDPRQLTIVGPLGESFEIGLTSQMASTLLEVAVQATDNEGEPLNTLRVVQAESNERKLRQWASRTPQGEVVEFSEFQTRELASSRVLELERSEVLTRVDPSTPFPFRPGIDGGQAIEGRGGWQVAWAGNQAGEDDWPAIAPYGGTPMLLTRFSGVPLLGRSTLGVHPNGIGNVRVNKAVKSRPFGGGYYGQALPTGPSNLVDITTKEILHIRYIAKPVYPQTAGGLSFSLLQVRDPVQQVTLFWVHNPVGPDRWEVSTLGTATRQVFIPTTLQDGVRWWMIDLQLVLRSSPNGQVYLHVNGVDYPEIQVAGGFNSQTFTAPPAITLLDSTTGIVQGVPVSLIFAGFAWRDELLTFDEHLTDAASCQLLP